MGDGADTVIGRDRESARLAELVRSVPVVTLTGPGGVGKTTLARHTASALACEFAGGVSWVDLTLIESSADVALAVAGALGVRDALRDDALTRMRELLADREVLLVLDNCEHVTEGAAAVAALAPAGLGRVLATSRETLAAPGEHVLVLEPLALPDDDSLRSVSGSHAGKLFARRAAAVRDGFALDDDNAGDVARLCRSLDGLPLALELAAARCRAMTPHEISDRLEERFSLLTRRKGAAARRHQSLRAAVDWSYEMLSDDERLLFDRLGVFVSSVTAPGIEAVCGAEPMRERVLDVLEALVDRSLVTTKDASGRTFHGMLETLRAYARERLEERGEVASTRERHADRCAVWADGLAVTSALSWAPDTIGFGSLTEFDEPLAALRWCLQHDEGPDRALRIIRPFWVVVHSHSAAEVTELAERCLARWPNADHELTPSALGVAATGHFVLGHPEAARRLAGEAVERERSDSRALIARRALALTAYHFDSDVRSALSALTECSALAEEEGAMYVALEMSVLGAQARAATGDHEQGAALAQTILARVEEARSPHMSGWTGYILGTILLYSGDVAGARERLERSLELARSVDFPLTVGVTLRQLGVVATLEGRLDEAAELLTAALDHFRAKGDRAQVWDALRSAAVALAARGDLELAGRLLAAADAAPGARTVPPLERSLVEDVRDRVRAVEADEAGAVEMTVEALAKLAAEGLAAGGEAEALDAAPASATDGVFRREGELWTLRYQGATARLAHLKGLSDLAALLAHPGREIHCLELAAETAPDGARPAEPPDGVEGDLGEVLDERARAEYRVRIDDLREEIEDAHRANDPVREEHARDELAEIAAALESARGLGGRPRRAGDPGERARTAVAWRIRNAVRKVEAEHPILARHLRNAVRTGTWCAYEPETPVRWEV